MIELPFLKRRKMLLGLAAASTAAVPVMAVAAETATAAPVTLENAELVRLGDKLPRAVKAYYASVRRVYRIVARWQPEWPLAPKEAIDDWSDRRRW